MRWNISEASNHSDRSNESKSRRCSSMRDPVKFYSRIVEDLQRIAATEPCPLDPRLVCQIKEAKEELARLQGHATDEVLVPAIRKCSRCGFIYLNRRLEGSGDKQNKKG